MKLALLLVLLSSSAIAQTQLYFQEVQILTRDVPTSSPASLPATDSKPLLLTGYTTFRLWVCPETGASITSGGIRLYVFNTSLQKWGFRQDLDVVLSTTGTNLCQIFGFRVDVPQGYLLPASMSVVVSSGTTITVRVDPGKN